MLAGIAAASVQGRGLIALIEDPSVVLRLLRHLGLPTEFPEQYPARAPPLPLDVHPAVGDDVTAFDPC